MGRLNVILAVVLCSILSKDVKAQVFRFHAGGMYVMDETVYVAPNPSEAALLSTVKGGPGLAFGGEYKPGKSIGLELAYFTQGTRIKDWHYPTPSGLAKTDLSSRFHHLMAATNLYFDSKGRSTPFLSHMAGLAMATFKNPDNGISDRKSSFAWGFRGGLDFDGGGFRKFRVFANALWTMRGIGGKFSEDGNMPEPVRDRYGTMIQFQLGANYILQTKSRGRKPVSVAEKTPAMPTVAPKSTADLLLSRRNRLVQEFTVSGDTLVIGLYDNAMVDQDSVSLYLNGRLIVKNLEVRAQTQRISFPVRDLEDTTDFVMVAENMGSIPPNTAMVKTGFGDVEREVLMESTDSTNAMIRFLNPGGRPRRKVEAPATPPTGTPEPITRSEKMAAEIRLQSDELRKRIPEAEVIAGERDIRVLFSTLMMFKKNSVELTESHRRELAGFQSVFLEYPDTRLLIEGYTDDTGNEPLNLDISKKRADVVMAELLRLGTPAERMQSRGLGQQNPRYPNDSESNRRRNRRVELVIVRD